jgi:hypothetical protein
MKNATFFRSVFLATAIYDFFLGLIFLFMYSAIFSYLNVPLPNYPMYLQLSAAFVVAMGVGYYFIYQNMARNRDLVKLGVVYKAVYSSFSIYFFLKGLAHIIFFWFGIIDLAFLLIFIWFLVETRQLR